ncbi:MAG TPA: branched-chain amino acid ABC transporter ATP-binding protein/permease [Gammaproteobacteria bacterium]
MTRFSHRWWILAFVALYGVVALFVTNSYQQLIMTVVPVWAVMGLSWNLLSGYSGLISFGHASFFGIGAYFVVLALIELDLTPWIGIPIAGLLGALAGLVIGIPTFRLRGHYFALAMLAYPLALLYVFEWLGYQEVAVPMKRDAPAAYMQFADQRVYVFLALALLLAAMIVTRLVERSRFGRSLLAIKQDETAAEASGIDTLRWKLKAITLSGAMAGVVGGFYAVVLLIVTPPAVFGMLVSAQALVVAMFGGVGTVWGPVIGAATLVPLADILHARLGHIVPGIQGVIYGLAIIAVVRLAPEGVFWRVRDVLANATASRRPAVGAALAPTPRDASASVACDTRTESHGAPFETAGGRERLSDDRTELAPTESAPARAAEIDRRRRTERPSNAPVVLEVRGLTKAFGGLHAVKDVSLDVREGEILGIIGPNGAGKTTLFNLLNGFTAPDAGRVRLYGDDVTGARPNRICRRGIGRTFQVVKPFARMTVAENVVIGAYVRAARDDDAAALAHRALETVGLAGAADRIAGQLTNRELRLMELARALASQPKLLLLDEILAGLSHDEVRELIGLIARLPELGITVVIIEHTMHAMVRLVDRFVVLDHGAVLASGDPDSVTRDPAVIEAYLGRKWLEGHARDR